jgi:stage III sporulation protein AE
MALVSTVFLGVLSAGTAVNATADSVSLKTAKFIIGTCVPVAGTALSGAVSTVSSSLSLLKSSVGIYGVVALAVTALPVITELLLWRLVLGVGGAVCALFSLDETQKLFKAVDGMLAFLTGALLLVEATFIISLSVCVSAGRTL